MSRTAIQVLKGIFCLALLHLVMGQGCATTTPTADTTGDDQTTDETNEAGGGTSTSDRVTLNVIKLTTEATTERGPAVGDGVLAFDAENGTWLAWLAAGQTQPSQVSAPHEMAHDRNAFAFGGKKLVIRDRYSGSLYVFDTETQTAKAMPFASINMGGIAGPNYWTVDGNLVATVNASTTTADGAGKRIKVVNISDMNDFTITAYNLPGTADPDAIDLDADNDQMVVRAGDYLYVYTISAPLTLATRFNLAEVSGAGDSTVLIRDGLITLFDDNDYFSILRISDSSVGSPSRNPARASRGAAMNGNRWAYFVTQTDDDGSTIDQYNRAVVGTGDTLTSVLDPAGTCVNGSDTSDGRIGFGATLAITPSGKYVFVAGETTVSVDVDERLFVSVDGADFQMVADPDDSLNAIRAAGVAASDNMVAFLIPASLSGSSSYVRVAYATLSP
ncbi:MAG TPA: hypothetical protein PKY77_26655 [Phycisphaerae bacterium]|nr:hypothetical protein [Phycisphaerae bacterium]HRY69344.1 hypothetical protein [Phycisphaerae bacterium]HSA26211.1 hypothetical protein [Phycisphaerae bacterium]